MKRVPTRGTSYSTLYNELNSFCTTQMRHPRFFITTRFSLFVYYVSLGLRFRRLLFLLISCRKTDDSIHYSLPIMENQIQKEFSSSVMTANHPVSSDCFRSGLSYKSSTISVLRSLIFILMGLLLVAGCKKSDGLDSEIDAINSYEIKSLSLDKEKLKIKVSEEAVLTASAVYSTDVSEERDNSKDIVWSTENPYIANVDRNGKVRGNSVGTTQIYASSHYGNVKASCVVTVEEKMVPIVSFSLDVKEKTIKVGESFQLRSQISPEFDAISRPEIKWSTSDSKVATVDETGLVTGVWGGTAEITATVPKFVAVRHSPDPTLRAESELSYTCLVSVERPDPDIIIQTDMNVGENFKLGCKYGKLLDIEGAKVLQSTSDKIVCLLESNEIRIWSDFKSIDLSHLSITKIQIGESAHLSDLDCSYNKIEALNLSKARGLEDLNCSHNNIRELDLSKNAYMTRLICRNNMLEQLDLSSNTYLRVLVCSSNRISTLNLTQCGRLEGLDCEDNGLTSLDISFNNLLTDLNCEKNKMNNLNLKGLVLLEDVHCGHNNLTRLTLDSPCLRRLYIQGNNIKDEEMEELVNCLRDVRQEVAVEYTFGVADISMPKVDNRMTKAQVQKLRDRGWSVRYVNEDGTSNIFTTYQGE